MRQSEAVHAVLSSFALVAPYVHSSREEELYQSHSTNELVVPNAGDVAPTIVTADVDRGGLGGAGGASKISSNLINAPFYGILMIHLLWLEPPFEQENEFFKSWKIKCDCTQPIDIIHKVKLRILSLLPRKCDKPKCRGLILSILGRPTR